MGSARVGSNPANCDNFFPPKSKISVPPVGFEPTTPSLRDWCSTTELKRLHSKGEHSDHREWTGSVAEWSKALVLGTSPKGRGFESHRCQHAFYCCEAKAMWRHRGSNPGHLACEASALPLSYIPLQQ